MRYGYFKVKSKPKRKKGVKAIAVFTTAVIIFFILIFRLKTGIVGEWFGTHLNLIFGRISFLIPPVLIIYSIHLITKKISSNKVILAAAVTVLLSTFSTLLKLTYSLPLKNLTKLFDTKIIKDIPYGGKIVGHYTADFVTKLFDNVSGAVITGIVIVYLLSRIFEVSIVGILKQIVKRIRADIDEWQKTRELVRKSKSGDKPKKVKIEQLAKVPEIEEPEPTPSAIKPADISEKELEKPYKLPSIELFPTREQSQSEYKHDELIQKAALLEQTLSSFNVFAKVTDISPGPTITRFELTPETGIKVQAITSLSDDIALAMKTSSVRIIAPVPGKGTVGIEIPNPRWKLVAIRDILSSEEFIKSESKLSLGLGETTDGRPYITDLIPMPHLLIAGATGSGKSVCI
ncbi:MAG: DNA translocase FtsK 4TM domain-containing protein, partial [Elusimicrobiota bacterium]|nr:DNA translocase FtsK 4TM domain-containing protein [Elusimicrobiota bacterium]